VNAAPPELGHSLVVGSDGHYTADTTRRIHILAPRRKDTRAQPFATLRAQHPRLFIEFPSPADAWAPAKVFQVRFADAVVILAGAQGSQQAGLTAAVSGKRLVCVGSFGGAARTLNGFFMQSRETWDGNLPDADTSGILQNPWNDTLMEELLHALRVLRKPAVPRTSRSRATHVIGRAQRDCGIDVRRQLVELVGNKVGRGLQIGQDNRLGQTLHATTRRLPIVRSRSKRFAWSGGSAVGPRRCRALRVRHDAFRSCDRDRSVSSKRRRGPNLTHRTQQQSINLCRQRSILPELNSILGTGRQRRSHRPARRPHSARAGRCKPWHRGMPLAFAKKLGHVATSTKVTTSHAHSRSAGSWKLARQRAQEASASSTERRHLSRICGTASNGRAMTVSTTKK
jgi:hypothetical protein